MTDVFNELSMLQRRAELLVSNVLKPSVFTDAQPLEVAVYQCTNPIAHDLAIKQDYKPIAIGFEWGPVWSTAWFRLRGQAPAAWAGKEWRVIFDTDTEALLWWEGSPFQGVEFHRQDVKLPAKVKAGDKLDLYIEAACNHMFGLDPGPGETHSGTFKTRWGGKLKEAHVALYHHDRFLALVDFQLLLELAVKLPNATPRSRQVRDTLRRALLAVQPDNLDASLIEMRKIAAEALDTPTQGASNTAYAVGHAHIDLGWLWPVRETKRKCSRTFSTVLRNMERHPNYRFLQSQAQAYDWVRQDYPKLFEEIKAAIKAGKWEAGGAMWVEADCNLSSGESLVRQISHGTKFWQEHFNVKQRFLWLPDVFGYSAALPQILKLAGLDAFITQKISWSQFNKFPFHTFHWQGIDGTEMFSHFLPADTYNAENTIEEFVRAETNFNQSAKSPNWLQSYGYGDGGGGPTEHMIQRAERLKDCAGLPQVKLSRVDDFLDVILKDQTNLPKWVGELYLELHRGTYTTQARNKRQNRICERLLQDTETAMVLGGAPTPAEIKELDRLWKNVLLNQFHDIIPGSSITWVYEDSLREYEEIKTSANTMLQAAARRTVAAPGSQTKGVAVLNTVSHPRRALVELPKDHGLPGGAIPTQNTRDITGIDRTLALTAEFSGPGLYAIDKAPAAPALAVKDLILENEIVRVELDKAGRVISLFDKRLMRESIIPGKPANQLVLYDDLPQNWEAWDVDLFYLEQGTPITEPAEIRLVESGPIRASIEFTRKLGKNSTLTQRVQLVAGRAMVEFETLVDWKEDKKFLRVLHPVNVLSDHATYEIQFGHVRRPTHFNTSWDYARFEVCAQRWMDLSEPGFGVALLNDCKYGHSCHGNVMGMSLLRSTKYPDPVADMAVHQFTYALMPHSVFDAAEVVIAAEQLNNPARVVTNAAASGQLLSIRGEHRAAIVVETIKPADDGDGIILRLWESRGGRGSVGLLFTKPLASVIETDLLERKLGEVDFQGTTISLVFKPFEIKTLRVKLAK